MKMLLRVCEKKRKKNRLRIIGKTCNGLHVVGRTKIYTQNEHVLFNVSLH